MPRFGDQAKHCCERGKWVLLLTGQDREKRAWRTICSGFGVKSNGLALCRLAAGIVHLPTGGPILHKVGGVSVAVGNRPSKLVRVSGHRLQKGVKYKQRFLAHWRRSSTGRF